MHEKQIQLVDKGLILQWWTWAKSYWEKQCNDH